MMTKRPGLWVCGALLIAWALGLTRTGMQAADVSRPPHGVRSTPAVMPQPLPGAAGQPSAAAAWWRDPSFDPVALERAYRLPPRDLPPEAQPRVTANEPSAAVWKALEQHQGAALQ